ncbi:hypothetical protein Tco_0464246 [Tanacetum coccineum]
MGRDTIQLEDVVSTISKEYLIEFMLEYGIPKDLHLSCLAPRIPSLIFLRAKSVSTQNSSNSQTIASPFHNFFLTYPWELPNHLSQLFVIGASEVDKRVFPTVVAWRTGALKDGMLATDSNSALDVVTLNIRRTPIQKQPELLLCLVGLKYTNNLCVNVKMDLFNLINAPNPTKVKTGTRPRAAHEVPLLTATSNCVIDMEDITGTSKSSGTPSIIEKSPHDFSNEDPPPTITERGRIKDQNMKRARWGLSSDANAPPKVLRKDHASVHPKQSTHGGKSLAAIGLEAESTFTSAAQETPADVSDPEPLSYAKPHTHTQQDIAHKCASYCDCKSSIVPTTKIPAGAVVTTENTNLVRQVALGSQLRLRFEQEVRLLKKAKAQVARHNERIHIKEEEIKRLGEEVESLKAVETEVHGLQRRT